MQYVIILDAAGSYVLVQGAYRGPAVSPLPLRPPSVMGSVLIDLSEQPDHEAMWMLEGMSA